MHLYGVVATDAERQEMIDMASRVLGAENVDADQYYVDATSAPRTGSATMLLTRASLSSTAPPSHPGSNRCSASWPA